MNRLTTSKAVELAIIEQGRKKSWLAIQLGVSRPTLDKKLRDNFWLPGEVIKLQSLGLID